MNPVLIAWPLGPVTSTDAIPSGSGLESIWLTGILNVPSAPVTGLTGADVEQARAWLDDLRR